MGYSLVGVYPCAVLKPDNSTTTSVATGPIRNTTRTNNRSVPYPTPAATVHIPVQPITQAIPQTVPQTLTPATVVDLSQKPNIEQNQTTINLAQPTQVVVAACNCSNRNNAANSSTADSQATTSTQMLFVPFTVPSFAPPIAATTLQSNCSPSKVSANQLLGIYFA